MVKDGSIETLRITQRNATTWDYEFDQIIAGRNDVMQKLPLNARSEFTVEIGKPTNEEMFGNAEWYRQEPWKAWDPASVPASKKEALTLSIRPETKSSDGWWDYKRLFEDGVLTVDVHYGYDYHAQGHLTDSKEFYKWLGDHGFRSRRARTRPTSAPAARSPRRSRPTGATRFYRTPTNQLATPDPAPTGPYMVGTFSMLLTNTSRTNAQFMTIFWYPAVAQAGVLPAKYVESQVALCGYYNFTRYGGGNFGSQVTAFFSHALSNAPIATNLAKYPVVLYDPGGWGHRRENTDRRKTWPVGAMW